MLNPAILSGGAGTRLWPVSRETYPKSFIRMADGQSLLQKANLKAVGLASVACIKRDAHESVRLHRTVHRPWGTYTILEEGRNFKIKRLSVKCGAALSLLMHYQRSEHWVVVAGTARVRNGEADLLADLAVQHRPHRPPVSGTACPGSPFLPGSRRHDGFFQLDPNHPAGKAGRELQPRRAKPCRRVLRGARTRQRRALPARTTLREGIAASYADYLGRH